MRPHIRLIALVSVTVVLLVTACQASAPAPIRFMVFGDPAEVAAFQKLVDAFERAHPNQPVKLNSIPSQSDYRTRLAADFAAGTPADVVLINYRRFATFAARGALEPLGPYLQTSSIIDVSDFYPQAIEAFTYNGQIVCIPQNISSLVIYYNRDLFDAAGVAYPADNWTWDGFLAAARSLTRDLDGDGAIDQYGLGIEPELIRLAPFVWQNGGTLVDNVNAPTTFTLGAGPDLEAFQWFVDLQVKWRVVPAAVEAQAEDNESRFLNGRTAMYFNSRRGVPTYREAAKFDWDVASLPVHAYQASVLHSDAYCVPASVKNKEAVWRFVEFANSVEGQTIVAETGRTVPSLVEVAESPVFLSPDEPPAHSDVFLRAVPILVHLPILSTWPEIEELANNEIERAFYGQITVEEAARTLNALAGEEFKRGASGETD